MHKYRGGCVICMNYDKFAYLRYPYLKGNFQGIKNMLVNKLMSLENNGFDPSNAYMYGFSFGAHVVLEAGKSYGTQLIKEIDVCDPSGPLFKARTNHRIAAQNVQCLHTSADYGTKQRDNCHQNWFLGDCGNFQDSSYLSPFKSHGVCPTLYNAAFEHDFYAVAKGIYCKNADDLSITWPDGFKMGYMETRKEMVDGQLFAETYAEYPFNQPPKITANSNYTNLQLYPAYESPPFPLDYDYLGLN